MGEFSFTKISGGYSINNGIKFLAISDGKLVSSSEPVAWTYKNNAFSISETKETKVKTSCGLLGWLFGYSRATKKNVTTTYYLNTVTANAKLSTCSVKAELYKLVPGEHEYEYVDSKDGRNHKKVCIYCKDEVTEKHAYDKDTHQCTCGAFDPSWKKITVNVDYTIKTTKQYSNIICWLFGKGKSVTTYVANVKVEARGPKVTKVEVSSDQKGPWTKGTSYTSSSEIGKFFVQVTTDDGKTQLYMIKNGTAIPAN